MRLLPKGSTGALLPVLALAPAAVSLLLVCALGLRLYMSHYFISPVLRASSCDAILSSGRYLDDPSFAPKVWQPDGCALHPYDSLSASSDVLGPCFSPGDQLVFVGDSSARDIFASMLVMMDPGHYLEADKATVKKTYTVKGVNFIYYETFFYNSSLIMDNLRALVSNPSPNQSKTYVVIAGGWHFAQKIQNSTLAVESYGKNLQRLFDIVSDPAPGTIARTYFVPPTLPHFALLKQDDPLNNKQQTYSGMLKYMDRVFAHGAIFDRNKATVLYAPVFNQIGGANHLGLYSLNGTDYSDRGRFLQANILFNHMCNQRVLVEASKSSAINATRMAGTCCVHYAPISGSAWIWLAILQIIGLGAVLLLFVPATRRSVGAPSLWTVPLLTVLVSTLAATYVFFSERSQIFSKQTLFYDQEKLYTLAQISIFVGILSLRRTDTLGFSNLQLGAPLVHELKGLCLTALIIIETCGYDRVPESFTGELLARVFFTCYAAAEVYSYTGKYTGLAAAQIRYKNRPQGFWSALVAATPLRYLVMTLLHLFLLPALIAIALGTPGKAPSAFDALARLAPISAKLLFWSLFVALAVPAVYATTSAVVRAGASSQVAIATQFAVLLGLGTLGFIFRHIVVSGAPTKASTDYPRAMILTLGNITHHQYHSVLEDYWVLFVAVMAAWSPVAQDLTRSANGLPTTPPDSPKKPSRVSPPAWSLALVIFPLLALADYLAIALPFKLTNLNSSTYIKSFSDYSTSFYARHLTYRGASYTPTVHATLCLLGLAVYVLLRLRIIALGTTRPPPYMRVYVMVSSAAYELAVLRTHVIVVTATGASALLSLIPTGSLAPISVLGPITTPATIMDRVGAIPGLAAIRFVSWINIVLVWGAAFALSKACAVGWDMLLQTEYYGTRSESEYIELEELKSNEE
ncbi:uncharacterized protein SAPINGB_P002380 [Magnusiomyces paraingens]|uniref:Cas1p 10 TM acyl transferase domain-containing protein n=1 Tax=Magnusiomyces paraingens TaxID=2606893 RepID=A0A5E8BFQ6_9ASCO|nr:uncharacterized protein SAPINGB_P002380 [Saprochaete ingens]VVT49661.1 unnamed protein product [Saprochaete ingens]